MSTDKLETVLFLSEGEGLKCEGGLRSKGYFKINFDDKPLITVITVVFNGEKYLEETIQSVINQTYDNVEYIIIDGGSVDGTLEVIRKYEEAIDYWVSEPDMGIYDAMNKGVKLASGDWLLFLGSDDLLICDIKSLVHRYFHDRDNLFYGNVLLKKAQRVYDGKFSRYKMLKRNICHQAIFYPKRTSRTFSYNLKYAIAADYALNLAIFGQNPDKCIYMPELISLFNDDGMSSHKTDHQFRIDMFELVKLHYPLRYKILIYPIARLDYYICRCIDKFVKRIFN